MAVVGCGTGCSVTAIIDARNGKAFFPRVLDGWTSIVGDYEIPNGEDVRTSHANSRLIKAIGRPRLGVEERWGPEWGLLLRVDRESTTVSEIHSCRFLSRAGSSQPVVQKRTA